MSKGFNLRSFAKINWILKILGKRDDGFHDLFTAFQMISLYDTIHFEISDELLLSCSDVAVPIDDRNLIIKAANALCNLSGQSRGAQIHLEKHIPSPGGLGGGSSNAAVALIGLRRLWNMDIPDAELTAIAAELGADVRFFLNGGTAIGTGRGDVIEPCGDITCENMLVVTPDVNISTRDVFESLNAPTLTPAEQKRILIVSRNEADRLDPLTSELKNDLEPGVLAAYPEVRRVKETLLSLGARNAAMSGSGASVFAVFDNKETRQAAEKALDHESTWRKFAVSTISRDEYREALGL